MLALNRIVLINIGWSPKIFKIEAKYLGHNQNFEGIIVEPSKKNIFTPQNTKKDYYFYLDFSSLSSFFKKDIYPLIILDNSNTFKDLNLIKNSKISIVNNHLQYALTWFALCLVIIIAYWIKRKKNEIH